VTLVAVPSQFAGAYSVIIESEQSTSKAPVVLTARSDIRVNKFILAFKNI
tara:strand:+ start:460 stop:609 length:150 start_codon:yes stop_codon:yes gene_type:complete